MIRSFTEAARRNGAHILQTQGYRDTARAIAKIAAENNVTSIALARIPEPLLRIFRNELAEIRMLVNLDDHELGEASKIAENVEMGVTMVDAGLAEVGSVIIMNSYSARLASTLPRRLAAILPVRNILATYEELAEYLSRRYTEAGSAILIAGPSGTSDIEMTHIRGVHGPADAYFILMEE
ncbi:MAG: LUD domain-containing protein [Nitrososphaerota archaeon]